MNRVSQSLQINNTPSQDVPTWPFWDQEMFDTFRESLKLWETEDQFSETLTFGKTLTTDSTVCALGTQNRKVADLYGNLTGRHVQVITALEELQQLNNPKVVIATWDQLCVEDFGLLYEVSVAKAPIGLLVANGPRELMLRALTTAAIVRNSRNLQSLRDLPTHAVIGLEGQEAAASHFDQITGPGSDSLTIQQILNGPSSILGFVGHSDGVDARLSKNSTLCARVQCKSVDLNNRPANCDVTGYCHRQHLTRFDALSTGRLIAPSSISARVVLMMSCYVARPSDCSVHPVHGLMSQLLQNPYVGAVVAPWEVAFPSVPELLEISSLLIDGHNLRKTLANYYHSSQGALNGCNRYLLFGDPSIRVKSINGLAKSFSPKQHSITTSRSDKNRVSLPVSTNGWLRARLERISRKPIRNSDGALRVSEQMLRQAFQSLELIESKGSSARLNELVLQAILNFEGSSFVHWFEEAIGLPKHLNQPTFCFGCGERGRLLRLETRFGARWMACCTQCDSFYADAPAGSKLINAGFTLTNQGDILHDLKLQKSSVIMMNLRSSMEVRTTWLLNKPFDYSSLPPGRSWLWLHALSSETYVAYSRMIDNRPIEGNLNAY